MRRSVGVDESLKPAKALSVGIERQFKLIKSVALLGRTSALLLLALALPRGITGIALGLLFRLHSG
jgi:hypothetical protein